MSYRIIIGLEVHVELKTKSKMFCACSADYFNKPPNSHVCPICLGLPGALPYPNKKAIEGCIMTGMALNCKIPDFSKFDRKNYFYPDLAKGYQISQYDQPFCLDGYLRVNKKKIKIRRVHLEEDTAKLIHTIINGKKHTLIDFNRSGVPLIEIVTEPDLSSPTEAKSYLKKLQQIIRYLGISDCDMEKGSMRCEVNISLAKSKKLPDYKVEIKNLNSFKFVEKASQYEIERQKRTLKAGGRLKQETRGWNEAKQITFSQRVKETAADYRYFPEPDIPPIKIKNLKLKIKSLPELPEQKMKRFIKDYKISPYQARILTATREKADYFEEAIKVGSKHQISEKEIANIIINKKIALKKLLPAELITILVKKKRPFKISGNELEENIKEALKENPKAVQDYKKGKKTAAKFLIGCVMKKTKGEANPRRVYEGILKLLTSWREA